MPERQFNVPQNTVLRVNLTAASQIRAQNKGDSVLRFAATAGNNEPDFESPDVAPIDIDGKQVATFNLAEHFPGVPGADTLWVSNSFIYGSLSASYS